MLLFCEIRILHTNNQTQIQPSKLAILIKGKNTFNIIQLHTTYIHKNVQGRKV